MEKKKIKSLGLFSAANVTVSLIILFFILTGLIGSSYAWLTANDNISGNTITSGEWIYSITYNLNGGTNNALNPGSYSKYQTTTLYNAAYSGNTFYGWYYNSNCSGTKVTSIPEGTSGNIILYALWGTNGLTFTSISGNTAYSVAGGTANNAANIIIPAYYNGKPVTAIAGNAFQNFNKLVSVQIPENITSIGNNAFRSCTKLTSVVLPATLTSIGSSAFRSCSVLTSVRILRTSGLVTGANSMFSSTPSSLRIYVPSARVNSYKTASYWSNYSGKIVGY